MIASFFRFRDDGRGLCRQILSEALPFAPQDYQLNGVTHTLGGIDVLAITGTGSGKPGYIYMLMPLAAEDASAAAEFEGVNVIWCWNAMGARNFSWIFYSSCQKALFDKLNWSPRQIFHWVKTGRVQNFDRGDFGHLPYMVFWWLSNRTKKEVARPADWILLNYTSNTVATDSGTHRWDLYLVELNALTLIWASQVPNPSR